jgi:hypothetical protein
MGMVLGFIVLIHFFVCCGPCLSLGIFAFIQSPRPKNFYWIAISAGLISLAGMFAYADLPYLFDTGRGGGNQMEKMMEIAVVHYLGVSSLLLAGTVTAYFLRKRNETFRAIAVGMGAASPVWFALGFWTLFRNG